ncbi:protein XNDC1N [Hyla sarda]|uniref:protein XNDC1N n=1 Tax=Hyla sarda TaxID=327740 RepID=UPI0024C458F0|nr:protein XNDC1N [Hyla sarda]XP_056417026.1 protein XNDC1N [Hyla sarda]XP_056417027.1 protein XNDC1N [Hyla sarda]XP_056417028.1 protein XNDC1N [Hyla sarda]XP_056417029.1 protein XNDC1N [Hyla sarda]
MAPIPIRHIVSFSSQDPKHPAENLLMESAPRPWLSCPRERSRQLRAELQLERACRIAYIDIGNSGSAFLQIDVGRSTWAPDKTFTTLLPMTTMMSPTDARAMRNTRRVRMFKEGDFLQEAAMEQWDRLRVTCGQPFNKQEQFGLSFIRIRSALNEEDDQRGPPPQDTISSLHPREESTEDPESWQHIKKKLRETFQTTSSPPPACMSRSARMLQLTTAKSQKLSRPITAPRSPPIPLQREDNCGHQEESPRSSGSCPETLTGRLRPSQKEHVTPSARRRVKMVETQRRRKVQTHKSERHQTTRRKQDSPRTAQRPPETNMNTCPVCAGLFPAAHLPAHAATCGEAPGSRSIVLSSSSDDDDVILWPPAAPHRPASWVPCPLCAFPFEDHKIEEHASRCGE